MAIFIEVQVDPEIATDSTLAGRLASVCPVDIFAQDARGELEIVDANVDECTLCELCLAVGKPGQVRVLKLYDGSAPLESS